MRVTQWFKDNVNPIHSGVYEIKDEHKSKQTFSYWNGERFCYRVWTEYVDDAQDAINKAKSRKNSYTCLPEFAKWRGLADKPKK